MTRKKKAEIVAGRVYKRRRRDPKNREQWIESRCWWLEFYHHRKIRKPTKTDDYQKAVRMLNRELELAAAGKILPLEAERMKFSDLTKMITRDYVRNERRSLSRAEDAIKHLTGFFGVTRPAEMDLSSIDQYVDYRKEIDKAANATVKYELAILKKGFGLAHGILGKIPKFPTINTANIRKGFFEEADFKLFVSHFEEALQPVLFFAYHTGWRMKSEVFPLQWAQVDFQSGEVRLEPGTTKTDEGRTFPFAVLPELEDLLLKQRAYTDQIISAHRRIIPWVFHRAGRKIESIRGAWAAAIEESKIGKKIPHDFRRTAVRNLERAGVPRSVAMKLVGHKTESIYRRYAIVGKNDLVDGLQRLADYRSNLKADPKVIPIKQKEANV
jgi:integrase